MTLLALAKSAARQGLDRAEHLLALGDKADLMEARLAADMLPFADQIAIAGSFARRATVGLVDAAPAPALDWAPDAVSVGALLAGIRLDVEAVDGPVLPRVTHIAGEARLDQTAGDYLLQFALPNMWFHLSMAYGVLRAGNVGVGKADFDGLHAYGHGPGGL